MSFRIKSDIIQAMKKLYQTQLITMRDGNISFKPKNENSQTFDSNSPIFSLFIVGTLSKLSDEFIIQGTKRRRIRKTNFIVVSLFKMFSPFFYLKIDSNILKFQELIIHKLILTNQRIDFFHSFQSLQYYLPTHHLHNLHIQSMNLP